MPWQGGRVVSEFETILKADWKDPFMMLTSLLQTALLVSKWAQYIEQDKIAGMQPTQSELELLALIRETLDEAECDIGEGTTLAAGIARTWGWFLSDVSDDILFPSILVN